MPFTEYAWGEKGIALVVIALAGHAVAPRGVGVVTAPAREGVVGDGSGRGESVGVGGIGAGRARGRGEGGQREGDSGARNERIRSGAGGGVGANFENGAQIVE